MVVGPTLISDLIGDLFVWSTVSKDPRLQEGDVTLVIYGLIRDLFVFIKMV